MLCIYLYIMYTCMYMYIHMYTQTTCNTLTLQNTPSFHILLDTPKAGVKINLYLINEEIKQKGVTLCVAETDLKHGFGAS